MAYLGQQPVVGRYILLDQISGGFNGTTSGFTMSTAGGAQGVIPGLAQNVLLSLGGVIQQPGTDYTISGSGLTFTTPPVSGTTFFATVLGDAQSVGTPSDGTVTPASIASGYNFAFPNLNVTGVVTIASGSAAAPSLTITGDTDTGLFSSAANTLAITTSGITRARFKENGQITFFSETPSSSASGISFGSNGGDFRVFTGNTTTVAQAQIQGGASGTNPDAATSIGAQLNLINSNTTDNNTTQIRFSNSNELSSSYIAGINTSHTSRTGALVFGTSNGSAPNERMRISNTGALSIGTNTNLSEGITVLKSSGDQLSLRKISASAALSIGSDTVPHFLIEGISGANGGLRFYSGSNTWASPTWASVFAIDSDGNLYLDKSNGDTNATIHTDAVFSQTTSNSSFVCCGARNAVGTRSETFRARVDAGLLVGRTNSAFNNDGHMLWTNQGGAGAGGAVYHERSGASTTVMFVHHRDNSATGTYVNWYTNNSNIGSITFSGGTVSYNPFLGSHWSSFIDRSKPDLFPGTILETVNQLMEWKLAVFNVNGETKRMAWNGPENVGDTVTVLYDGSDYTAKIELEDDAEELNKHVCIKVNDTAGSNAVFGVFLGWDDTNKDGKDKVNPIIGAWNDMNVAAVGNYFIRIASGQTIAIGDLIEADGNGCGVVQSDDIIRSKTVAKVTSALIQKTYDDGSFLVTCVLCCG